MSRFQDDKGNDPHTLGTGKITRVTDRAVLAVINGKNIWIPKSCVHDDSEAFSDKEGENEGTIVVKTWWAEKEGHA